MSETYDVYFKGEIDDRHSLQQVRENFKKQMGLPDPQLDRLFSGKPVRLKKQIEESAARAWQKKLSQLGAVCEIRPVAAPENPGSKTPPLSVAEKDPPQPSATTATTSTAEATPQPTRIIEKTIIEKVPSPARSDFIKIFGIWANGLFWVIVGLVLMLSFSPFPGGEVRRGLLLGLLLASIGIFRIWRRHRA